MTTFLTTTFVLGWQPVLRFGRNHFYSFLIGPRSSSIFVKLKRLKRMRKIFLFYFIINLQYCSNTILWNIFGTFSFSGLTIKKIVKLVWCIGFNYFVISFNCLWSKSNSKILTQVSRIFNEEIMLLYCIFSLQ